jgi:hypothetical protein
MLSLFFKKGNLKHDSDQGKNRGAF